MKVRASQGVSDKERETSGLRRGVEESAACWDAHVGTESTSLLRFCQKRKEGGGRCF